ncbi:hypothetical protein [Mesorhizobium amorphae]|uniref:hypothetical protein n=1 Tax=Mesorhizobium amorphae TaxID=71433 RepID=UPI001780F08F|nr:hypothetical protein [Mesorhizobium amorphae]
MSASIRLKLEVKLDEWQHKNKAPVLPLHAVAAVLARFGNDGDGPLWRDFVENAVSPKRIAERLHNATFYLSVGRIDDAYSEMEELERHVDTVKNMIANTMPMTNTLAAPDYERGLGTLQASRDGHAAVHGTEDEKLEKWKEQCAAFDAAVAAGKKTIGAAELKAAEVCGVSQKSISRARKKRELGLLK